MRRELVDTESELEAAVSDYERMGADLADRSRNRAVVSRGARGAWVWHLAFLITVPIVGNVIYSAYRRFGRPEEVVIRIRGAADDTADADPVEEDGDTGETPEDGDDAEESGR